MYLYRAGNYIIADDGSNLFQFSRNAAKYSENAISFTVLDREGLQKNQIIILKSNLSSWEKDAIGTKWSEPDLRDFLQNETNISCSSSGVETVTGYNVDNTDPKNPIILEP